jgi:hypothetical protein
MNAVNTLTAILLFSLVLSGCQSTPDVVQEQQSLQEQNQFYLSAKEAVNTLMSRLDSAEDDRLDYFAPGALKQAQRHVKSASSAFEAFRFDASRANERSVAKILSAVERANLALDTAYRTREVATTTLAESLAYIERLKSLDVPNMYPSLYRDASRDLDSLVAAIAKGNVSLAQDRQANLLPVLLALEIKAITKIELEEVELALADLRELRPERYVPNSFQKAVAAIESAEAVIAASPRNKAVIGEAATLAKYEITHAGALIIEVKNLMAIKKGEYESYLLALEGRISAISDQLGLTRIADRSLSEQFNIIEAEIADYQQESLASAARLDQLETQLATSARFAEQSQSGNAQRIAQLNELLSARDKRIGELQASFMDSDIARANELTQLRVELSETREAKSLLQGKIQQLEQEAEATDSRLKTELERAKVSQERELLKLQSELLDREKKLLDLQSQISGDNESQSTES